MKKTGVIFFVICSMLLFAACRSSRHAERTVDVTSGATQQVQPTPSEPVQPKTTPSDEEKTKKKDNKKNRREETVITTRTSAQVLTAKLNLTLEAGSKRINLGGTYRLKRNEVIQMNLTYTMIFSINVGTIELTPDYFLIIDRMGKRYCRTTYAEVPMMAEAGVDFNYLQRVFWGEVTDSPSPALSWDYADWTPFGDGQYPAQIQFTAKYKSSSYRSTFRLSNLQESANWSTRTEPGSRYTPISLDSILNVLMSIAK